MPGVFNIFDLLEKFEKAPIRVNSLRCVVVRNRNASCSRCAQACTSSAISIVDNEFSMHPDRCIGCGTCSSVCPAGVFEPLDPNDDQLLSDCRKSMLSNEGKTVIACAPLLKTAERLVDSEKVACVGCLGRIEEGLAFSLFLLGSKEIVLVKGRCDECSHSNGLSVAEQRVLAINEMASHWDADGTVRLAEKFPSSVRLSQEQRFDESRRRFFKDIQREARGVAEKVAEQALDEVLGVPSIENEPKYMRINDEGVLPQFMPPYRARLLNVLERFGPPDDIPFESDRWASIEIDGEACRGCRHCATFCLTGALSKFDEVTSDGKRSFGLVHNPGICTQCKGCEDACVTNALRVGTKVSAFDIVSGNHARFEMQEHTDRGAIGKIQNGFGAQIISH